MLFRSAGLASGMHAKLAVHLAQVVPYPLPIKSPPVPTEILEESLTELSNRQPLDTSATLYLCRDKTDAIRGALKPESLVVISTRRRWWRTSEERLARRLMQDGHRVLLIQAPARP